MLSYRFPFLISFLYEKCCMFCWILLQLVAFNFVRRSSFLLPIFTVFSRTSVYSAVWLVVSCSTTTISSVFFLLCLLVLLLLLIITLFIKEPTNGKPLQNYLSHTTNKIHSLTKHTTEQNTTLQNKTTQYVVTSYIA